jgi:hypothetical protein
MFDSIYVSLSDAVKATPSRVLIFGKYPPTDLVEKT